MDFLRKLWHIIADGWSMDDTIIKQQTEIEQLHRQLKDIDDAKKLPNALTDLQKKILRALYAAKGHELSSDALEECIGYEDYLSFESSVHNLEWEHNLTFQGVGYVVLTSEGVKLVESNNLFGGANQA